MTKQEILENKKRFTDLLLQTKKQGIESLIQWLESTDFFEAPASTKFHEPYEGGLVEHSLTVYDKMQIQVAEYELVHPEHIVHPESIILCSLLHDICKANFYKAGTRNVKNEKTGVWEKVPVYLVEDSFPMGHGEKSMFLIERFVRLEPDEAMAIRWHMGAWGVAGNDIYALTGALEKFPIVLLLQTADMHATYLK
ncbi:MAG: hydrolase [Ruthenibacterium sp.]